MATEKTYINNKTGQVQVLPADANSPGPFWIEYTGTNLRPIQDLYGPPQPRSTFTITDATQGRSVAGSATLKNEFNASVNALIKVLNGDKYAAFKKTINANWVGADATDFLNDVEKTRAELEKSLKALTAKFNAAVEADAKQFSNFQSKNVK